MADLKERLAPIFFDRWRFSIQTSMDLDQLLLVVSAYMSGWSQEHVATLPPALTLPIVSSAELMARAVEASRTEVTFVGPPIQQLMLRELSLTLAFAAARFRYLQALRSHM